ncbi:MAG: hypothetical protein ACREJN_11480 [Nitrospiraceae bacterium]
MDTAVKSDLSFHEDAAREFHDHERLTQWDLLSEYDRAAERGRRMAAEIIKVDPERRKLVESVYGVPYCKNRYPEAYCKES